MDKEVYLFRYGRNGKLWTCEAETYDRAIELFMKATGEDEAEITNIYLCEEM